MQVLGLPQWLAWPGFLWLALMFYLLIALAILEIPRLAIALRRTSPRKPRFQVFDAPGDMCHFRFVQHSFFFQLQYFILQAGNALVT